MAKKAEECGVAKEKIVAPVRNGVDAHMSKTMSVKRSKVFINRLCRQNKSRKKGFAFTQNFRQLNDLHFFDCRE
jgi:hypothetical protein